MKFYFFVSILLLDFARADHDISEGEYSFCHTNLTKYQMIVDIEWENDGCVLNCDIVDFSRPIGLSRRFPELRNPISLVPCGNDDQVCYHGKCMGNILHNWYPTEFEKKRPPYENITDLDLRICNHNLTNTQWTVWASLEDDNCVLDCEILDTEKKLGTSARNYHIKHPLTVVPCVDDDHVCQAGKCVRKTLATFTTLRPWKSLSGSEKEIKRSQCRERKMYCDMHPDSEDWRVLTGVLRTNCFRYESECTDVPGLEAHRWM